jgi:spore cortex formation protein SpoVR/YcgB (stage V sporulation)
MALSISSPPNPLPESNGEFVNLTSYSSITQGTWIYVANTSQIYNLQLQNSTTADGDEIVYKVYLSAGTYQLSTIGLHHTDSGIIKIYLNTDLIDTIDQYSAAPSQANQIKLTSVTVSDNAIYSLKIKLDGKNASSSDYNCRLSGLSLMRLT